MSEAMIHYSQDLKWYYITRQGVTPTCWMSVEAIPGPATEEMKRQAEQGGVFTANLVEIRVNDGRVHCRKALPFTFFKVKSGKVEPIGKKTDLYLDYACHHQWPAEDPKQSAMAEEVIKAIEHQITKMVEMVARRSGLRVVASALDGSGNHGELSYSATLAPNPEGE